MLRLDDTSRVMVIGTEGDTDPVFYRHVVGKDAEEILVSRRVDFQVRAI